MENNKLSVDQAVPKLYQKAREEGIVTVFDRYEAQQPQCGFGLSGLCCRHCVQGPCRIDPFGEGPQVGICGATAEVIVARNLLRQVAAGAAAHVDHAYDVLEVLEKIAEGAESYGIKDAEKLKQVAHTLGIATANKTEQEIVKEMCQVIYFDFANSSTAPMTYLKANSPKERLELWEKLGVLPRNPDREIREALHQTTMGMDADPVNLILKTLRLGLVDGFAGLKLATDLQDIIFGTPQPVVTEANLGVLKEDYVNIIVHGHVPLLSEKIVEWSRKLEEEAKKAGAKGINLAGICCTGNEVLMRQGVPLATNFLAQELAIVTGAVDLMVVDVQCIMPSLAEIAACYHTRLVTTMPIVKIPGAEHVPFNSETADTASQEIVRMAIASFQKRNPAKVYIPREKAKVVAGFSVEAIVKALAKLNPADPLKPLIDNIVSGNILGVVATVGCNNAKVKHDWFHIELVKELIKNNVLVVTTGCSAHALAKAGLMDPAAAELAGEGLRTVLTAIGTANDLGGPLPPVLHMGSCVDNSRIGDLVIAVANYLKVSPKDLPIAASAPEYQHEKALSIGTWAVAMGIMTHLGVIPPVLGSPKVTQILTQDAETLIGGKFYVETDPYKAAAGMIEHIKTKRALLNL
ncbi:anaerobic carbon-monoxide dehydrogenase catalytic subunit [Carboxydothermus pertinax]|uniref:Carbon monoxide dehydrogenase n=1 Tax=Carboxydothermus pertinax TaxID=870242 RepID=A0A1L8CST4_9THEO|nr:anaerobic carbon-monoxide dehydrogenase catalytic subunit [Carboxydothermus pertinax]GAV21972.1 carbon-monoxide dehydrogenase catalytic subunit [Carboxydothermus pertinax]